jgi:hypothetical protein
VDSSQLTDPISTNKPPLLPIVTREGPKLRKRAIEESGGEPDVLPKKRGRKSRRGTEPFCCDLCKATSVTDPSKRRQKTDGVAASVVKRSPGPRYKTDPETGQTLVLCNACGLKFGRKKKTPVRFDEESKQKFLVESKHFVRSLVNSLKDNEAACLCCTSIHTTVPCGCVQKYLRDGDSGNADKERAQDLLQLSKKAKRLARENSGLKKSVNYETLVQQHRQRLRDDMGLCEKATKNILHYSNNFLYKKLKTVEGKCRVQRKHGKHVTGKLKPIAEISDENCCPNRCIEVSLSM